MKPKESQTVNDRIARVVRKHDPKVVAAFLEDLIVIGGGGDRYRASLQRVLKIAKNLNSGQA